MDANLPIGLGYWRSDEEPGFPDPQSLVRPDWLPSESLDTLVRYLRTAPLFSSFWGHSYCRFHCGADHLAMGSHEYWDGVWFWPEGLAHYIERHHVCLPDDFVRHALSDPLPVALQSPDPRKRKRDWNYWIEWSTRFQIQ